MTITKNEKLNLYITRDLVSELLFAFFGCAHKIVRDRNYLVSDLLFANFGCAHKIVRYRNY